VVESFFGAKVASVGIIVGGYYSLVNTQREEKETAGNSSGRPFEFFGIRAGAGFPRRPA
jgi:hypothetical protein